MESVTHLQPLTDAIARVRQRATAFSTSFFADRDQVEAWIGHRVLFYSEGPGGVLIFRRDRDFYRLYHVAADAGSLSEELSSLDRVPWPGGGVLVSDLVGRPEDISTVADVYRMHGFRKYGFLFRMACLCEIPPADGSEDSDVVFAMKEDVLAVAEFLEQLLDPFVDQIPGAGDLRDAAVRGNVLIVRRSGLLAGLLIFERTGLTTTLRYWYVSHNFRGQGVGARLIRKFFRLCGDGSRVVLWVVGSNADGIAKYRHYGFKSERLEDQIMVRDK